MSQSRANVTVVLAGAELGNGLDDQRPHHPPYSVLRIINILESQNIIGNLRYLFFKLTQSGSGSECLTVQE